MRFKSCILFVFFMAKAIASETCSYRDFNCDGKDEQVKITKISNDIDTVTIVDGQSGTSSTGSFSLQGGGVNKGYIPNHVVVNVDFESTSNPYINKLEFYWDKNKKTWVLTKVSSWEEPSRENKSSSDLPTSFSVKRYECCLSLADFNDNELLMKERSDVVASQLVNDDLRFIEDALNKKQFNILFSSDPLNPKLIPNDLAYEFTKVIKNENIELINNFAFYAEKYNQPIPAIIILKGVINAEPNRVVAYLNLADSYWDIKDTDAAKLNYKKYIELMNNSGRQNKIPSRVFERSK